MEHNLVDGMSELPVPQSDLSSLERDLVQEKHGVGSLDPCSKEVKLGDAIGAATYLTRIDEKLCNPQIGTLGCWVEVKLRGKDRWLKMGLSCYHILRSCLPGFPVGTPQWSKWTGPMLSVIAQIIPYQTLLAGRRIWRDLPPRTEEHLRTWSTHRA